MWGVTWGIPAVPPLAHRAGAQAAPHPGGCKGGCLAWRYWDPHPSAPGAAMQDELGVSIRDIMSKGKKLKGNLKVG